MKNLFCLCALAACLSATAQDYNVYFAVNGKAVLMDENHVDSVATYAEPITAEPLAASVGGAIRRLIEPLKCDDAVIVRAGSKGGINFYFLGESANIQLDQNAKYFAWRVTFSNDKTDYIAARYVTCLEVVRDWMARMFNGEI